MSPSDQTPAPSVSVIMPIGRVDSELSQQLDALVAQTWSQPWELVLSLNTPDRAERQKLEKLLGACASLAGRIVDSSDARSASHARNVGAAAASGKLLLFCDGDDIADEAWIAEMVAALASHRAVGGYLDEERLAIRGQEDWRPPATPDELPSFLGHPYLVSANMGVTRAAFELTNGFDTSLIRGEDIALSWELAEHGVELAYAPDAVIHYRHRRGLLPMMRQHYLYGRGFSQILARHGVPGASADAGAVAGGGGGAAASLRALKPNSQRVDRITPAYFLRRGSIAAGRVVGLVAERRVEQSADDAEHDY